MPAFHQLHPCLFLSVYWHHFNGYIANVIQIKLVSATTSCKNVETLPCKNDLSYFKSLLVTGLWDIILSWPSSLPFKLVPPSFEHGDGLVYVASNFDNGWRGDHKHKIMAIYAKIWYGVSSTFATGCSCLERIIGGFEPIRNEEKIWMNNNGIFAYTACFYSDFFHFSFVHKII